MNDVRWGLLSTANINKALIPAIRASERGELVAVASRSEERAAAYAREWDIPQAFGSYESMLESGAVNAVYVSLPNNLHAEWSIRAMENGVHVLCEKPFALTLQEVDAMIDAAETTGCVLAEAFMYRHHPQMKQVGAWVREGRLGEVMGVRATFNFAFRSRDNIRLDPQLGGGCLWDVGVYPLSFAQYIMGGPPRWVVGDQWLGDTGVDEFFMGQMHYAGGRTAQIMSAFRTPFYTMAEVVGTEGRLLLDRPFTRVEEGSITFFPADGEPETTHPPQKNLYLGEVEDMHDAILDSEPLYLSLTETRNHVRTVLALYESAEKQRVVQL
ncbi:MAG: Gfo/Idh/MocA family oxidoreductase [Candidatus Promineifilaceae bacterium]|nr:Gfo/Idh/MocA family oxidoreductase [Candidatus Promineifilaceae bacterium]